MRSELFSIRSLISNGWERLSHPVFPTFEGDLKAAIGEQHGVYLDPAMGVVGEVLRLLKLGDDSEIIFPGYPYVAAVKEAIKRGHFPVLASTIDFAWSVKASTVLEKMSTRTRAVIAVDIVGELADLEELVQQCSEGEIHILCDNPLSQGQYFRSSLPGRFDGVILLSCTRQRQKSRDVAAVDVRVIDCKRGCCGTTTLRSSVVTFFNNPEKLIK